MRTALNACLVVLVFLLPGCGSISSRWRGDRGPYVGVKLSAETVTHYSTEGELIAALDIPLSAVVDTFCLPYDLTVDKPTGRNEVAPSNHSTGRIGYKR